VSKKSRLEYVEAIRDCYYRESKKQKSKILDEFCQVVGLQLWKLTMEAKSKRGYDIIQYPLG
jgi:hypothetical protein